MNNVSIVVQSGGVLNLFIDNNPVPPDTSSPAPGGDEDAKGVAATAEATAAAAPFSGGSFTGGPAVRLVKRLAADGFIKRGVTRATAEQYVEEQIGDGTLLTEIIANLGSIEAFIQFLFNLFSGVPTA